MQITRRDALRGLLALGLVAPSSALFAPAQRAAAQVWPPVWFWDTAFTPKKLTGLQLWLRADLGTFQDSALTTNAVADADPVGGWQDQSGNGRHAVQATAAQRPTLKLAIQNGRRVLRWDGVDDNLIAPIPASATATLLVVLQQRSAIGGISQTAVSWNSGTATSQFFTNSSVSATLWSWFSNQAAASVVLLGTPTAWTVMGLVFASTSSLTPYANGTAGTGFDPSDAYATQTSLVLGAASASSNRSASDLAEVILYNRVLATNELAQVTRYLGTRYAIGVAA